MDDRLKDDSTKKKPYEKPEVRQVPLKPEEAVLGYCKTASSGVAPGSPCSTLCLTRGS